MRLHNLCMLIIYSEYENLNNHDLFQQTFVLHCIFQTICIVLFYFLKKAYHFRKLVF